MATLSMIDKVIESSTPCFIIAEIGQNHQGSITTAKQLITIAKECGADCVKFQKTHLPSKFTSAALQQPYTSCNSWGATYEAHRQHLEFTEGQFQQLQAYANDLDILFSATAMDINSLQFLASLKLPFIKIGSGDATNYRLLHAAAAKRTPLIISTGMLDFPQVQELHKIISSKHDNFALLHCTSSYPTPLHQTNIGVIETFRSAFPKTLIGYSGHEEGFLPTIAAVSIGAKIVERHMTLCKRQKGSDHCCSLEPDEFKAMVKCIRHIEMALMGSGIKRFQPAEMNCYLKLGKSIVAAEDLPMGTELNFHNLDVKVAVPKGLDASLICQLIGKCVTRNIEKDDTIQLGDYCTV